MPTFKIIKIVEFTVEGEKDKHKHYVLGYKGRALGFNDLRWEAKDFKVAANKKTLEILAEFEIVKREQYLDIMPKFDLEVSELGF